MTREDRRNAFETRFYERLTLFRAINAIAVVAVVLTLGSAVLEWLIERETFPTLGDACWWAIVTVSTTGFGDVVPHTVAGKTVAAFTMIASLAWVPVVTAVVITLYVRKRDEERAAAGSALGTEWIRLDEIAERLERVERLLAATTGSPSGAAVDYVVCDDNKINSARVGARATASAHGRRHSPVARPAG
jgi:ion channel